MPTERRLNQHILVSSNYGVPCSDRKNQLNFVQEPTGISEGILLQDISKSLKITHHLQAIYVKFKTCKREAAYRLEDTDAGGKTLRVHKGCKRTHILGGGDPGGRDNEMRLARALKFMTNSTPLF